MVQDENAAAIARLLDEFKKEGVRIQQTRAIDNAPVYRVIAGHWEDTGAPHADFGDALVEALYKFIHELEVSENDE